MSEDKSAIRDLRAKIKEEAEDIIDEYHFGYMGSSKKNLNEMSLGVIAQNIDNIIINAMQKIRDKDLTTREMREIIATVIKREFEKVRDGSIGKGLTVGG